MSIKDLQQVNVRQMETLKNKFNREISRMEDAHQDLKADMKKSHAMELVDIEHQNQRKISEETEKKEKVLTQMKEHLENTRRLTDKEIQQLKDHVSKVNQQEHQRLSTERERQKMENDLYLEDMNYRFGQEYKKMAGDTKEQLAQLRNARQAEYSETETYYQDRINQQTNQFTEKFQADSRNYQKMKDDQDRQFKNERMSTNVRQQQEMAKITTTHSTHLEAKDKNFRKGLKDQDLMFEKKYAENLKKRNEELEKLNELNNKVMAKMKSQLQEKLTTAINRADDPFYRFTELSPVLKQYDDRVEIAVEIPEHAKSDVNLTINNKEAIVNFNRRYDDTRKEEGKTNKLHKVESFTTRLATQNQLDPKSVKSSYADGVMTFVIKHA